MNTEPNEFQHCYAKFWRCALQVNPYSYSQKYRGTAHEFTYEEYIEKLIKHCKKEEIKVIGLANHGDVSEVEDIRKRFNEEDIIVFPGFEIACNAKIHWVCLFHEETRTQKLIECLGRLRLSNPGVGNSPSKLTSEEIIECITKDYNGFCYAAHITDENGLLYYKKTDHLWTNEGLQAAQIPGRLEDLDFKYQQILKNKDRAYKREKQLAIINAKDVDQPEVLKDPKASCFIKMTKPGFDAFKIAFKDPKSRIRLHHQIKNTDYSIIKNIKVKGGYLDGISLNLSPHLNTLIGGRGTGKSTLVECIRYCFEIKPKGDEAKKLHDQIIRENLGKEKARVEITLISSKHNGKKYKVLRTFPDPPEVIDDENNVSFLHPKDLLPKFEIYGQNEIYELAKDNTAISKVLERFIDASSQKKDEILSVKNDLRSNAKELEELLEKKDAIQEDVLLLPRLEERKKNFDSLGVKEILKNIPLLETEKNIQDSIEKKLSFLTTAIDKLDEARNELTNIEYDPEDLPHKEILRELNEKLVSTESEIAALITKMRNSYKFKVGEIDELQKKLSISITKDEKNIEKKFKDIPSVSGKSGAEIGIEYQNIIRKIGQVKPKKDHLSDYSASINVLRQKRRNLLREYNDLRFERTKSIQKAAKKITKKLEGQLLIEIIPGANRKTLKEFLVGIDGIGSKKTSWVDDNREVSIPSLTEAINNNVDAIKKLDWDITDRVAEYLVNLPTSKKLELEEIDLQDHILIKLNTGSKNNEIYRPLDKLSTGQQCTAILHLLLLENNEPLIMDQPEDNLDNAFIADRIVKELREEKTKRQFIFSTHNANIPVFGDAEWIGVLKADNEKAKLDHDLQGSIDAPKIRDHVTKILEGGKDAFIQRKEKYDF